MSLPWGNFLNQRDVRETNTSISAVASSSTTTFTATDVSTTAAVVTGSTIAVNVKTGESVLLILTADVNFDEATGMIRLRFSKDGSPLGSDASSGNFDNAVTSGTVATSNHFVDVPGNGSFTYGVWADGVFSELGDLANGRITAIVLK